MKLEQVTQVDKKNRVMSKNFDDDVMLANCILQKLKTELRNLLHSSHTIALSKGKPLKASPLRLGLNDINLQINVFHNKNEINLEHVSIAVNVMDW